jgi:hypothetical protein
LKIGHNIVGSHPKNQAKLPQKHPKNLTKSLVFIHPKMTFYFWTRVLGTWKNSLKSPKMKQNYPESTQKSLQNLLFLDTPNWVFTSGPGELGT